MGTTLRLGLLVSAVAALACDGPSGAQDGAASMDGSVDAARPVACGADRHCDDGSYCTGVERCVPGEPASDARGCVTGTDPCGADGLLCNEALGRCEAADCDEPDRDGDGSLRVVCGGDDCDDGDANRFPGNPEWCDPEGHDEDCDESTFGGLDEDGDGVESAACCNAARCGSDCDDHARAIYPDVVEQCNARDDDCDGVTDGPAAFCPVGTCVDTRCRAVNWEHVWGSGHVDVPGSVEVDARGNVYADLYVGTGGADLDRDGLTEPQGGYLISIAADGRVRWVTEAVGRIAAVTQDGASVLLRNGGDPIRIYSTADGSFVRDLAIPLFDAWTRLYIHDLVWVGRQMAVVAGVENAAGSATLVVVYDESLVEVRRHVFERAGAGFAYAAGAGDEIAIGGYSLGPIDVGLGEMPAGSWLTVLASDLTPRWAFALGRVVIRDVAVTEDGGVAAVGVVEAGEWAPPWAEGTVYPSGTFVASFGSDGSYGWSRVHDGAGSDAFSALQYDGRGNIFVSGWFSGTLDLRPRRLLGPAVGGCDAFFALLDATDGHPQDARALVGDGCESVTGVRVDPFGGMVVLGQFTGRIQLPSGSTYTSAGITDAFLVRISDL